MSGPGLSDGGSGTVIDMADFRAPPEEGGLLVTDEESDAMWGQVQAENPNATLRESMRAFLEKLIPLHFERSGCMRREMIAGDLGLAS